MIEHIYNSHIPIECPDQDVYENSVETIWKNIIGNHLNEFITKSYELFDDNDINCLNIFLDQFNSLYEKESVFMALDQCLNKIGNDSKIFSKLAEINNNCKEMINRLFDYMNKNNINNCITKTPCTGYDIGRVANKKVYILKKPSEFFSQTENYLDAIGQLLSNCHTYITNEQKSYLFLSGFELLENEKIKIQENVSNNIQTNITMIEILIMLEKHSSEHSQNLSNFEILKNDSVDVINKKMISSVSQSYFFIGKLFGIIANQIHYQKFGNFYTGSLPDINNQIKLFLIVAGIIHDNEFGNAVAKGFQRIALSHVAHGMSPAELVSRIASSVRTSYPIALITGLSVRSGIYHGGAMQQAIPMIKKFFEISKEKFNFKETKDVEYNKEFDTFLVEYVTNLFSNGKIFGFGHRIHKSPLTTELSADPRALEYFNIINELFVHTNELDLKLSEKFVKSIRRIKQSLGCNSDYAIALFCVLMNIPENDAEGMFVMCRIPGLCTRIVRELLGKANARRLPFPVILPYIEPKFNV